MRAFPLVAACLGGCALWHTLPLPPSKQNTFTHSVYVVQRGYHTDIGLNVGELSGPIVAVAARFPTAQTLLIGFGDRTFVTTRRRWLGDWLLALFPGRGAMLVTALRTTPQAAFGSRNVVEFHLPDTEFQGVETYVNDSFVRDHDLPVWIGDGPYAGSLFYAAARTYDLLDTCNTWTSAALRSGGLDVPVGFVLFSAQTMRAARGVAGSP